MRLLNQSSTSLFHLLRRLTRKPSFYLLLPTSSLMSFAIYGAPTPLEINFPPSDETRPSRSNSCASQQDFHHLFSSDAAAATRRLSSISSARGSVCYDDWLADTSRSSTPTQSNFTMATSQTTFPLSRSTRGGLNRLPSIAEVRSVIPITPQPVGRELMAPFAREHVAAAAARIYYTDLNAKGLRKALLFQQLPSLAKLQLTASAVSAMFGALMVDFKDEDDDDTEDEDELEAYAERSRAELSAYRDLAKAAEEPSSVWRGAFPVSI